MAPRTRSKKIFEFPSIVLEAKASFEKENSKYFAVMKKLTESKDAEEQKALIKMWISLDNSIKKQPDRPGHPGDWWPHYFVGYAQAFSSFPPYFYQPKSERNKLINDIKKHISDLSEILKTNRFDHHLAHADSKNELYFIERMEFVDSFKAEQSAFEKPTISELLKRLQDTIESEIISLKQTRKDRSAEARLFVSQLGKYIQDVHGQVLNSVLVTATKAIMGVEYTEVDIRHILKRNGIGKTKKKSDTFANTLHK